MGAKEQGHIENSMLRALTGGLCIIYIYTSNCPCPRALRKKNKKKISLILIILHRRRTNKKKIKK